MTIYQMHFILQPRNATTKSHKEMSPSKYSYLLAWFAMEWRHLCSTANPVMKFTHAYPLQPVINERLNKF